MDQDGLDPSGEHGHDSLRMADYPFGLPDSHFLIDGASIRDVTAPPVQLVGALKTDALLAAVFGQAITEPAAFDKDRLVAFLTCGSNASAQRLRQKLEVAPRKWAVGLDCRIRGLAPVFAATVARYGSIPATWAQDASFYSRAYLIVTSVENVPALLGSEGTYSNYNMYRKDKGAFFDLDIPTFAFISRYGPLLHKDKPILLHEFALRNRLPRWRQVEALDYVVKKLELPFSLEEYLSDPPDGARIRRLRDDIREWRTPPACRGFSIERFSPGNRVRVLRTPNRRRRSVEYEVLAPRALMDKLGIKNHAVLASAHPGLGQIACPTDGSTQDFLAVHCRVLPIPPGMPTPTDDGVYVDQTLRTALGFPFNNFAQVRDLPTFLAPADRGWRDSLRIFVARLFGYRPLVLRYAPAAISDIEKGYARVSANSMRALGSEEGANLVVERPFPVFNDWGVAHRFKLRSYSICSFEASETFLAERRHLEATLPDRYLRTARALFDVGVFKAAGLWRDPIRSYGPDPNEEPDLPPMFVDGAIRSHGTSEFGPQVQANHFTVVQVRRSTLSAVLRDAVQVGLAFSIGLIQLLAAVLVLFPEQLKSPTTERVLLLGIFVCTSLVGTAVLTLLRLRHRV